MTLTVKLQDNKQELLLVADVEIRDDRDLPLILEESGRQILSTYRQKKWPVVDDCPDCVNFVYGRTHEKCGRHYEENL